MRKYAILLSGGINRKFNYERYRNDLEFAYKVLIEDCDYDVEKIQIFFADGKTLKYNNSDVPTAAAIKADIIQVLEWMADDLQTEDFFTLIVSNHGGNENRGCIRLWGKESLELEILVRLLNQIKARKTIILGECYGGNILSMDVDNACIVTANDKDCVSYACLDWERYAYDEFLLHFLSFIHGMYPDGQIIMMGENDITKAYEYARVNDGFSPYNSRRYKSSYIEIPQLKHSFKGKITL